MHSGRNTNIEQRKRSSLRTVKQGTEENTLAKLMGNYNNKRSMTDERM